MKKNIAKKIALTLAIGTSLAATPVFAEEASQDANYELPEVVVTATKTEEPVNRVTQKVAVIGQAEINRQVMVNGNIAELLAYQPGVYVDILSRDYPNWGFMGGLGNKYNLFLVDGQSSNPFFDTMAIDPHAISQIEMQRGAASVIYAPSLDLDHDGNQSPLSGVTNIILKDKIDKPLSTFSMSYGNMNTKAFSFYNQGSQDKVHYFFGANFESSDYAKYGVPETWNEMTKNPEYQKTKLYLKTTYLINDNKSVSLFVNHFGTTGDQGREFRDYDHKYDLINVDYKDKISEKLSSELKVGYRKYDRNWTNDNYDSSTPGLGVSTFNSKSSLLQTVIPVDLTFALKHGNNSTLTFGADYQHASIEDYSLASTKTLNSKTNADNYGLFLQEEFGNGPWTYRAGLRYNSITNNYEVLPSALGEIDDATWHKLLWSAGTRYKVSDSRSWYSNVGTSFITPAAKYVTGTTWGVYANPNLKPESGITYDLGFEQKLGHKASYGVRGFYSVISDAIVEESLNSGANARGVNVGEVKSAGVELEYKQKVRDGFSWFVNYTYTNATLTNPYNAAQDGKNLQYVPKNMGNIGCTWEKPQDYTVSVYAHIVGDRYTDNTNASTWDAYQTYNVKAEKYLSVTPKQSTKVFMELNNITNKKYDHPWSFRDVGFTGSVGVKMEF